MRFDSSPHHSKLTITGYPNFLIPIQVVVDLIIDLLISWVSAVLEKKEDKVMNIIISSIFKCMCLVIAMRAYMEVYTRHYKREFHYEIPFCSVSLIIFLLVLLQSSKNKNINFVTLFTSLGFP